VLREQRDAELPEAIRKMGGAQREHASRLAQQWRLNLNDSTHAANLTDMVRMAYEENAVSDQRRAELTDFALASRGLDAAQRATVMNALRDEYVLPQAPMAPNNATADADTTFATITVTGKRGEGYGVALLDRSVDSLARNTGYFVENVGKVIQDRPLVGIALEALNIAAAPVAYAVNQAIAASPVGEAIQNVQERITGAISNKFTEAGYDSKDSTAGGVGAMAVMGAVAGWGAAKVLSYASGVFGAMRAKPLASPPVLPNQALGGSVGAMRRRDYVPADYHGKVDNPIKSRGPVNGQDALDASVQVKTTSPRRVGIDYATGDFVVFDQTLNHTYHGHVRAWSDLDSKMQHADKRGRILGGN
jgi:hypothetical protein